VSKNQNIENRFKDVAESRTFNNILKILDLDKKSVLDLGCSYGEFLVHFGIGSVGVTISKDEVEYGKGRGLDIIYGNIESDDFLLEEKFDTIFANNLFEHLYSPHHFLCKIKKYLKPGGVLILGVPCIPKIVFLLNVNKFSGSLASAHINFFTKDTLVKTVEKGGWHMMMTRGFYFIDRFFDRLLNPIYPHFYVVASIDPDFKYSEKRLKELAGYNDFT
jgi:SAM-dependent methyltransferase